MYICYIHRIIILHFFDVPLSTFREGVDGGIRGNKTPLREGWKFAGEISLRSYFFTTISYSCMEWL